MHYLSFLMGADQIEDSELVELSVEIVEKDSDGDRKLRIPADSLSTYSNLIKARLNPGFWNDVIGADKIIFIFKYKDGKVQEFTLSPENESEISKLCTEFNNDPIEKTGNVYKYLSGNGFYKDLMLEHYSDMINR